MQYFFSKKVRGKNLFILFGFGFVWFIRYRSLEQVTKEPQRPLHNGSETNKQYEKASCSNQNSIDPFRSQLGHPIPAI